MHFRRGRLFLDFDRLLGLAQVFGRFGLVCSGLDLYQTPAVAIEALLRVEQLPRCIWEPAAGRGAIVRVLRDHGHGVVASDIYDYGGLDFVGDFLTQRRMPAGCGCLLTNPPFYNVEAFVAHALELSPLVIVLLRLAFFEAGSGKQRKHRLRAHVLDGIPPARIHVFRRRLPMMHRDQWAGRKSNSGMAFSWWVWDRNYTGPIVIDRISWEAQRAA
jgi:hypothetical protein